MINSQQLAKAIFSLAEKGDLSLTSKVLKFIEDRRIILQIPTIIYYLNKIIKEHEEKRGIQIETAHEIQNETVSKIKYFLKVDAGLTDSVKVRKELIAGFRVKWNGVVYDSSVATSLKKLEESIIK